MRDPIPAIGDRIIHQGKILLIDQRTSDKGTIYLWSDGIRYSMKDCLTLPPKTDIEDAMDLIDGIGDEFARVAVCDVLSACFEGVAKRDLWGRLSAGQKAKLQPQAIAKFSATISSS